MKSKSVLKDIGLVLLGATFTFVSTLWIDTIREKHGTKLEDERKANELAKTREEFYHKMLFHLEGSDNAFRNQCVARDRLVKLLESRPTAMHAMEYEKLFRLNYHQMNEDERILFTLLRGITQTIAEHNQEMLTMLKKNPQYGEELSEFHALYEHLDLWVAKYRGLFPRDDIALIYVGVEEKKPFPTGIEDKVKEKYRLIVSAKQ